MTRFTLTAGVLLLLLPAARAGNDLPLDAQRLMDQCNSDTDAIRFKADQDVGVRRDKLLKDLEALRDSYTKAGKYDEALAIQAMLRGPQPTQCVQVPQCVEVLWGGNWWPAEILRCEGGRTYIHYTGWADSWNEWVTVDRIRPSTGSLGRGPIQGAYHPPGQFPR
jgi:hypothetical protein